MRKLKEYRVFWKTTRYGDSYVEAHNLKEAKQKAKDGKDFNFEENGYLGDWFVEKIEFSDYVK